MVEYMVEIYYRVLKPGLSTDRHNGVLCISVYYYWLAISSQIVKIGGFLDIQLVEEIYIYIIYAIDSKQYM